MWIWQRKFSAKKPSLGANQNTKHSAVEHRAIKTYSHENHSYAYETGNCLVSLLDMFVQTDVCMYGHTLHSITNGSVCIDERRDWQKTSRQAYEWRQKCMNEWVNGLIYSWMKQWIQSGHGMDAQWFIDQKQGLHNGVIETTYLLSAVFFQKYFQVLVLFLLKKYMG